MLVLDMIEILPPLGKCKYDTWRILPVKCYFDNFVRLRSCIQNINTKVNDFAEGEATTHQTFIISSDDDRR
jgi:hypothetical protein